MASIHNSPSVSTIFLNRILKADEKKLNLPFVFSILDQLKTQCLEWENANINFPYVASAMKADLNLAIDALKIRIDEKREAARDPMTTPISGVGPISFSEFIASPPLTPLEECPPIPAQLIKESAREVLALFQQTRSINDVTQQEIEAIQKKKPARIANHPGLPIPQPKPDQEPLRLRQTELPDLATLELRGQRKFVDDLVDHEKPNEKDWIKDFRNAVFETTGLAVDHWIGNELGDIVKELEQIQLKRNSRK